ncbi:MAG TPA: type II toxin-antitoxin system RelE/ParE family toxin [Thermoanaerobaculia bacterium]|nr:type II toxin-antitoxin system RelE/ParE family toxin [Thermoanaerobaculia bacterium]
MARYRLVIKKSAAKELQDIAGKKDRQRVVALIEGLADDPRPPGAEKLSGTRDRYRIRQGNFRIVYEIEDDVLIVSIADARDDRVTGTPHRRPGRGARRSG